MIKVLVDANFMFIPAYFNVDIISEIDRVCGFSYELCMLDSVYDEVRKLSEQEKGKVKAAARLGLQIIKNNKINILNTDSEGSVDDQIADYAAENGCIVATQDQGLKRKLKARGVRIITLRQKNHLKLEE